MHELSVCSALVRSLEDIAREHGATRVEKVTVRIGPLSGIEPGLLRRAWPLAAVGTVADHAELCMESAQVRVRCSRCGAQSDVEPNRLLCGTCGDFRTNLVSGDEMLLASVELETAQGERHDHGNRAAATGASEER